MHNSWNTLQYPRLALSELIPLPTIIAYGESRAGRPVSPPEESGSSGSHYPPLTSSGHPAGRRGIGRERRGRGRERRGRRRRRRRSKRRRRKKKTWLKLSPTAQRLSP